MPLILSIETATDVCSVAVSRGAQVVASRVAQGSQAHAQQLTLLIQAALIEAGARISDLAAVAVTAGPGSYTGLRIGTATAKGIAYATGARLIAVPTLQGIAAGAANIRSPDARAVYCPMLDARRMEVYIAAYDSNLQEIAAAEALVVTPESMQDFWAKQGIVEAGNRQYAPIVLVGNGVEKCKNELHTLDLIFMNDICLAQNLSQLAYQRFTKNQFEDLAYFEPNYLKGANITVSHKKTNTL